jgi:type VI secretion system protein ImpA
MVSVSVEQEVLLKAVSAEAPSGPELEYDPEFTALLAAASPAVQERLVGPSVAAEEPNWRALEEQAAVMLGRTKDLRIAAVIVKARLRQAGLPGLASGIGLLRALCERYWDSLYPQVDSDGDATARLTALRELCDKQRVLAWLRNLPLLQLPALGAFTLKDLTAPIGEAANGGGRDVGKIDAAFAQCDLSHLQRQVNALQESLNDLGAIESWVVDKLGAHRSVGFDELRALLEPMHRLLRSRLELRVPAAEASVMQSAASTVAAANGNAQTRTSGPLDVRTREDVQRVLDVLCLYYEQHEPSSPVPLLLRRARRLSAMNFMEILRDLAPAGTPEVEVIRGREGTEGT